MSDVAFQIEKGYLPVGFFFHLMRSLFQVGTEYRRTQLCVKEKDTPYVAAGRI